MMHYLLVTNIWVFYLKEASAALCKRLQETAPSEIAVCAVVWAELLYGARKHEKRDRREALVVATLDPFVCLPFDLAAAHHYARIRDELERQGRIIGGNDLMIAAIALANNLTVVTNNSGESSRVSGLVVEDWSS